MSKEGIQRELEQLRKDVEALSAARQREEPPPATEAQETPLEGQPMGTQLVDSGQDVEVPVGEQPGLVPIELPRPVIAALGAFLVGILLGRCLR